MPEKLSLETFEQLDQLMKVTDPKGWLGLVGAGILLFFGMIWFIFGRIPTKVDGTGMLINVGGIQSVTSNVSGRIDEFNVKIGDIITKNQPIATVAQLSLFNDIANLKQKIAEQILANEQKEALRKTFETKYNEELVALNKKLLAQQKLLTSGVVIETEALETKGKIIETSKKLDELKIERLNDQFNLKSLYRELNSLQDKFQRDSTIVSPFGGIVFEIEQAVGDVVSPGTTLVTLESVEHKFNTLEGILYISAFESKKIQLGMKVAIIPTTVKPEEYGSIIGNVTFISSYPATFKGMMRILHNEEFVKHIMSKGSLVEVHVRLQEDKNTISQYKWTTRDGPPIKIQSGTLVNAKITVKEKKPYELIIPQIRKMLGNEE